MTLYYEVILFVLQTCSLYYYEAHSVRNKLLTVWCIGGSYDSLPIYGVIFRFTDLEFVSAGPVIAAGGLGGARSAMPQRDSREVRLPSGRGARVWLGWQYLHEHVCPGMRKTVKSGYVNTHDNIAKLSLETEPKQLIVCYCNMNNTNSQFH